MISKEAQNQVIEVAKGAGNILIRSFLNNSEISHKKDGTLVSRADYESSEYIRQKLSNLFPDFGIIDEERTKTTLPHNELCWVIDPLDATREYLSGGKGWSILICLLHKNKPIFGLAYQPMLNKLIVANKSLGAYQIRKSKVKIHTKSSKQLSILVSKSRTSEELDSMLAAIKHSKEKKSAGSFKIVEIALGKASCFICPRNFPMYLWDVSAPSLILQEAGGIITDLHGKDLDFNIKREPYMNGILASCNKETHNRILSTISRILI